MSYKIASQLGIEQSEWLRALAFYEEEIKIFEKRLTEVANKNSGIESMSGVEHFQNQFFIQRKNIQDLKHQVKAEHQVDSSMAQGHMGRLDESRFEEHYRTAEEIKSFEDRFTGLRHEFNQFLTRWM